MGESASPFFMENVVSLVVSCISGGSSSSTLRISGIEAKLYLFSRYSTVEKDFFMGIEVSIQSPERSFCKLAHYSGGVEALTNRVERIIDYAEKFIFMGDPHQNL